MWVRAIPALVSGRLRRGVGLGATSIPPSPRPSGRDGVRFLAVATHDTRPRVLAFARTSRITSPVLLDPAGTLAQRLQVSAVPATVILDRDGRIAARLDGHLARQTLPARLDALLFGTTDRQPP
jgi:AhpC/TSA family